MESRYPDGPPRRLDVSAAARQGAPAWGGGTQLQSGCCRSAPARGWPGRPWSLPRSGARSSGRRPRRGGH